jgi:hypothetical protein
VLERVTIDFRFCGPPTAANGGYCAGLLAPHISGELQATFFAPVPLGRSLSIERRSNAVVLTHASNVLVEGEPAELGLEVPRPVSFEAAESSSANSPA